MTEPTSPGARPPEGDDLAPLLATARAKVMSHADGHPRRRGVALTWAIGVAAALVLFAGGLGVGGAFAARSAPPASPLPATQVRLMDCYRSASEQTPFTQIILVESGGESATPPELKPIGLTIPASPTVACSSAWGQFAQLASLRDASANAEAQYLCGLRAKMTGEQLPCPMSVPVPVEPTPARWVTCVAGIPNTVIVVGLDAGTPRQACESLGLTSK